MSVAKSIMVQPINENILLESWMQFAGKTSLKEFTACGSSQIHIMYDGAGLLEIDVWGLKAQKLTCGA